MNMDIPKRNAVTWAPAPFPVKRPSFMSGSAALRSQYTNDTRDTMKNARHESTIVLEEPCSSKTVRAISRDSMQTESMPAPK